jgi:hypothetical protein
LTSNKPPGAGKPLLSTIFDSQPAHHESFYNLKHLTTMIEGKINAPFDRKDIWLYGNDMLHGYINCSDGQKSTLLQFLDKVIKHESKAQSLAVRNPFDPETPIAKSEFIHRCEDLILDVESGRSRRQLHNISMDIILFMGGPDGLSHLFKALSLDQIDSSAPEEMLIETDTFAPSEHRILVNHTERAFAWDYRGEHALPAFLEYLDVQWLTMIELWDPSHGGTLLSRCGTIVQSSCAGKSRLVDRYGDFSGMDDLTIAWATIKFSLR